MRRPARLLLLVIVAVVALVVWDQVRPGTTVSVRFENASATPYVLMAFAPDQVAWAVPAHSQGQADIALRPNGDAEILVMTTDCRMIVDDPNRSNGFVAVRIAEDGEASLSRTDGGQRLPAAARTTTCTGPAGPSIAP